VKYSSAAKASDLSEDYWRYAASRSPDETAHLPVDIQLLDDSAYLGIIKNLGLPAEEYTGGNAKMIAVAKITSQTKTKGRGEISQIIDVFRNPSVTLTLSPEADGAPRTEPGKQVRVTLVETVPPDTLPILGSSGSDNPIFFRMLVPYSLKDMLGITDNQVAVKGLTFLSKTPAQSVAEMEKIIQGEGITAEYRLYNTYDMLDENRNMVFIVNVFAYTFIIMISLIAIANVFNTISTNIKLRRRELAMLRSVGMSQRSFQRMMNFECAFYGMRALLFGLPLAVVSSWLIFKGMYAGGADNISFIFPWESIGISVFSVLFIVFITMLYAISKIKRENIIDGLRDDMT
jgi:putative ABC transport system permease protein